MLPGAFRSYSSSRETPRDAPQCSNFNMSSEQQLCWGLRTCFVSWSSNSMRQGSSSGCNQNHSRQLESTPGAPGSSQRPPEAPRDAMKYLNLKNNRAAASPAPPPVNEYFMLKKVFHYRTLAERPKTHFMLLKRKHLRLNVCIFDSCFCGSPLPESKFLEIF